MAESPWEKVEEMMSTGRWAQLFRRSSYGSIQKGGTMCNRIKSITLILLSVLLVASCGTPGEQAVVQEHWSLVKLLSEGERTEVFEEPVTVNNCGYPEKKTTGCAAGLSNDISVSLGGGVQIGTGLQVSLEAEVIRTLGVGTQSMETLELPLPPTCSSSKYIVVKEYSVKAGEAIARSSSGKEETANYVFNARCSVYIKSEERSACPGECQAAPEPVSPTSAPAEWKPTAVPPAPAVTNFEVFAVLPWQNAGVQVHNGDFLQIDYLSGEWTGQTPYCCSGPDNAPGPAEQDYACMPMPQSVIGQAALIGRIGDGPPFKVGKQFIGTVSAEGPLYLRMNDCDEWLTDNQGSVVVSVQLTR